MSDRASFGENKGHTDSTQPVPERRDNSRSVTDAVIEDMEDRRRYGIQKYKTELLTHNGRDVLTEIYQELLDAVMYMKQALMERDENPEKRVCPNCKSRGFPVSVLGLTKCTFCDGTEGGHPPHGA